jgi:hypothetical protein
MSWDQGVGISHSTSPHPVSAMGGCQASPPNPPHAPRHSHATTFPTISPTRVAQTAFILFSTFLNLRPVSDASD